MSLPLVKPTSKKANEKYESPWKIHERETVAQQLKMTKGGYWINPFW